MSGRWTSFWLQHVGPFSERVTFELPEEKPANAAEIHIFTGPNGSGKSTILHCFEGLFGRTIPALTHRIHKLPENAQGIKNSPIFEANHSIFSSLRLDCARTSAEAACVPAGNQLTDFLFFYATSNSMSPVAPQMFEKPLHASFAYAGGRNLEHVEIRFIEDVADNPLFNTMSFNRTESSSDFVKWIAATMTREALASRRGETGAADRHRASLGRIDAAISAILGVPFRLEFHDDPRLRVLARLNGTLLTLDALPDGVKSIVSWIGDLLMRLDRISWPDSSMEVTARPFALFLDEIEVHLHPKWQRAVLPAVQHIFPNAQIFVATHSPFVVASVSGAWVHRLDLRADGNAFNHAPIESGAGMSYELVTAEIFGVPELFDVETEQMLTAFRNLKTEILAKRMEQLPRLRDLARTLAARGQELENIMGGESRQILRIAGIDLFAEEAA